jgi:glyoxylase-like metal-dependent hydrolase (beta-lactamase superfamily II)
MHFSEFLPEATADLLAAERDWLEPRFADLAQNLAFLRFQTYVLRKSGVTVLVDSCVGNDKERGGHPAFHRLTTDWLQRLQSIGVEPAAVNYVMCTHMHSDHIGWNTRWADGRWRPTFPHARYVFAEREYRHRESRYRHNAAADHGAFGDSVLPVMEAGLVDLVASDHDLGHGITLECAAGHTPGNVIIHLRQPRAHAILSGDVIHHPIQVCYPEWSAAFCEDRVRSAQFRQRFVERYSDSGVLILPAHFPAPTIGSIRSAGVRWRFEFLDERTR